ncbi:hypothetical protein ARMGADRAFT_912580 [Armillaria gallica]|uniref:ABC transporter domain-containing protein n=1 Tax=Armillaria gallica TaxID=47427 RepID=A0A2H3F157_ARMGA|nr:hypothetical protein ARMGADRAFT_912580 [Armillaria gallica]
MDTHVNTDTVHETSLVSTNLRQPESVPLAEKEAYVEKCIKMCGLETYADIVVTIEHRKRKTIAVELAAKLLFFDEPTSGLDSQSTWVIIMVMKLNQLCGIHQPSAELFQVFDRLLLLKKSGQTVFFGDLGHNLTTLIQYFERNKQGFATRTKTRQS